MSSQEDSKKIIEIKTRRLQILKEQQAVKGFNSPPELQIEIEDIEKEIRDLQTNIQNIPFSQQLTKLVEYEHQSNYQVRFEFLIISGDDRDDVIIHALKKDSEDVANPSAILICPNKAPLLLWDKDEYIEIVRGGIDIGHGIFLLADRIK